jgi:hypothetical protein
MKALTDKIIEALEKRAHAQFNEFARKQLLLASNEIKELEKEADFEEVARVMMKHLANPEKYHPHYRVIIDSTNAELLEGKQSTGHTMDYIPD